MRALPSLRAGLCALAVLDAGTTPTDLTPGQPLAGSLAAGQVQVHTVDLRSDVRWRVLVEQAGVDVALSARGPADDSVPVLVNGPLGRFGTEWLVLPAGAQGRWRLELRAPASVATGDYTLRVDPLPVATPAQRTRLAAEVALGRVGELAGQATAASRRAALEAAGEALRHWRTLGARREEGLTLDTRGALHVLLGEWSAAFDTYGESLAVWRSLGERRRAANALNERGVALWSLGRTAEARQSLEQALAAFRALRDSAGEGEALSNLGLVAHVQGDGPGALDHYERALAIWRARGDTQLEATLLNNVGGVHFTRGEPDPALQHFERALSMRRAAGDLKGEAEVLNNIALVQRVLGDAQRSLEQYARVLEIARAASDKRAEARTLNNIGVAYQILGEPERALGYYEQALPLRRAAGDREGEATTLSNLGLLRLFQGEPGPAVELNRQAVELQRAVGSPGGQGRALVALGRAQAGLGDLAAAQASFEEALARLREAGDRAAEAEAQQRRGELQLRRGEPEAAQASLREALEKRRAVRDAVGEALTLEALARAEHRLGRSAEALARTQEAIAVIEALRTRVVTPDLRASFLAAQRQAYALRVELLMGRHRAEPAAGHDRAAFEASEAARGRTLLEVLAESGAVAGEGGDPQLRARRAGLLRRLAAKAARQIELARRPPGPETAALERDVAEVRAELDNVEAEIRRRDPRYGALTQPTPVRLPELQARLPPGTLLLAYALGAERSFLWVLGRERFEAHDLPAEAVVESAARRAYAALSTREVGLGRAEQDPALAALSDAVLGPLTGRLGRERLVIVADGALHYIPFAALLEPGAGGASTPLVLRHEIVALPSVALLANPEREQAKTASRAVAVFADPVFDADDTRLSVLRRSPEGGAAPPAPSEGGRGPQPLGRLSATRREAEAIAALVPADQRLLALDFDASRERLLDGTPAPYRIVHVATHGLLDAQQPALSGLVLSRFASDGRPRDGLLGLHDIYGLRLGAELVVLSGCQTALGREVRGEGLVGVTRGFMYAGVPQVAASLWRVSDRATAELMAAFYRGLLRDGLTAPAALRQAQLALRSQRRWADPYFWAGFVVHGPPR